jgi:hypothetical protein
VAVPVAPPPEEEPGTTDSTGGGFRYPRYRAPAGYSYSPEPYDQQVDQSGTSMLRNSAPQAPQALDDEPEDPKSFEPGQVVTLHADMSAAMGFADAETDQFRVRQREKLPALGLVLTVLQSRSGEADTRPAIGELRGRHPDVGIALNQRYELNGGERRYGARLIGWGDPNAGCGKGLRIGMLDTLPDLSHPAFAGADVIAHSVLPAGTKAAPPDHATEIASLLVGRGEAGFPGLAPAATLAIAGAFRERRDGDVDAPVDRLVVGLDWLVGQKVDVAAFAFTGHYNEVLDRAIAAARSRGVGLVGAAGNDGPDEPTAFPASLETVVAVTAVDSDREVYRRANRGPEVLLSAPGVDVWAARPGSSKGRYVSGTSYAVPFVAAALAQAGRVGSGDGFGWLVRHAVDLGSPGPDPVYGHGLLHTGACGSAAVEPEAPGAG